MKNLNKFFIIILAIIFSAHTFANSKPQININVIDIIKSQKELSTFFIFLQTSDLVETLKIKGPYTIFVPTNEAFAKVPKKDLVALLKNKEQLKLFLTYHIIPAYAPTRDFENGLVATMNGQNVDIKKEDNHFTINQSRMIKIDLLSRNGVIHEIDSVLMPIPEKKI